MQLDIYDRFIVTMSGGKDSLACMLHLLELGADKSKIELWHHDIDGGDRFMDWPCTPAYCRKIAKAFELPIYQSWREGGFRREMLRNQTPTSPTHFEKPGGLVGSKGGQGKPNTRMQFPQVSADLSVRWCSAYLKIDVSSIAIKNQERFNGNKTLFVTGERAQESTARAKYNVFEPHRTDARNGRTQRWVDHWRPVHAWSEAQVWEIIARHRINPHPAYRMGWGRVSCFACIFGSPNQWASVRVVKPELLAEIAAYEQQFGKTIHRGEPVTKRADRGTPYAALTPELIAEAMSEDWHGPVFLDNWQMPAGAFGESTGPT